ncbi:MAG: DUF2851 family protein [Flavobacteriales bacterium]|nr:DUF2851 family protein [Flavobacteriales bacterium]
MNEKILHHIWKYKRFTSLGLISTQGKKLCVLNSGTYNTNQGTDFLEAKIKVDDIEWNGNIEIHTKSSDFYLHKHENDSRYTNIILHVVYYNDIKIPELEEKNIPTLELKDYVDSNLIKTVLSVNNEVFSFIPCEHLIQNRKQKNLSEELNKIYLEKLNEKHKEINAELTKNNNNWEAVLFSKIAYSFGLKINAQTFQSISENVDFSIIKKISKNRTQLEAFFFGFFNELENPKDEYQEKLKQEYAFLKHKFSIQNSSNKLNYLRLRPNNFPTIRLSQLADLYHKNQNLFDVMIQNFSFDEIKSILEKIKPSEYWNSHYTFGKTSKKINQHKISNTFTELLFTNAIIPVKYSYHLFLGNYDISEIISKISQVKAEKNTITNQWNFIGIETKNALETQSLLYLYKNYCSTRKCMECELLPKII